MYYDYQPVKDLPRGIYDAVCPKCGRTETILHKILGDQPYTCPDCRIDYVSYKGVPKIVIPIAEKAVNHKEADLRHRTFFSGLYYKKDFVRTMANYAEIQHPDEDGIREYAEKEALNYVKKHPDKFEG